MSDMETKGGTLPPIQKRHVQIKILNEDVIIDSGQTLPPIKT